MTQTATYFHRPGDLLISGVFPLHKQGPHTFQCGRIQEDPRYSLHVMAFMFALDTFNSRYANEPLNNISVGGVVLDSCSNSITSAKIINDFETCTGGLSGHNKSAISQTKSLLRQSLSIRNDISKLMPSAYQNLGYVIVDDSLEVGVIENILGKSSFGDMKVITDELIDPKYIARALVNVVIRLGWKQIFIIAENSAYYQSIASEIISLSTYSDICVVFQTIFESQYEWRVENALEGYEFFPVILISRKTSASVLFSWLDEMSQYYFWILTAVTTDWDGFDANELPRGSIILKSPDMRNNDFLFWLQEPILKNVRRSPWMKDYWQYNFDCRFNDTTLKNDNVNGNSQSENACSDRSLKRVHLETLPLTSIIIRTVDSILHRVRHRHLEVCKDKGGFCTHLIDDIVDKRLGARDVSFSYQGEQVDIDMDGQPIVTLSLFNVVAQGYVKVS